MAVNLGANNGDTLYRVECIVLQKCIFAYEFLPLSPPAWRGILSSLVGGWVGGGWTGIVITDWGLGWVGCWCWILSSLGWGGGTHISVAAWWIFSIRNSVELSRPVVVHCHRNLLICPIWACPWYKNLSKLAQIGSRLCGTQISETAGWI